MESEYQRENQDTKMEIEVKPTKDVNEEEKEVQASYVSEGKDKIILIAVALIMITLKMILKMLRKNS